MPPVRGLEPGKRAALVVNEMQNAITNPAYIGTPLAGQVTERGVIARINALTAAFRAAGAPVIFATIAARTADFDGFPVNCALAANIRRKGHLVTGTANAAVHDGLVVDPSDIISHRSHGMAPFTGTTLDATLRGYRIETVVLCGVSTNIALPGAATEAVALGYNVVLAEDCAAGATPETHQMQITQHLPLLATVTDAASVIAEIGMILYLVIRLTGKSRPGGCMRAARCEEYGEPGNVVIRDIPAPVATPGHLVVDVAAAAVNYPDLLFIANTYQVPAPLPFTPGSEFAGRVAAVGEGVTGVSAGDLVYGSTFTGAMAEQVLVPAEAVAPVPPGMSLTEAAAFRVTYLTAYHALVTAGGLQPGQWVVVLGAAGGVGTATVDIAVRLGARVIAAASSPERLKVCAELGAEAGIDYVSEDLKQRIREITGDGADLVVDPVGDRWAEPALRAIRWGGRFVSVGYAGGEIPRIPLNIVLLKNITVRGLELRTWGARLPEETARARQALIELVAAGMRPTVSEVHELADVAAALQRVADRLPTGKVVIRVAP